VVYSTAVSREIDLWSTGFLYHELNENEKQKQAEENIVNQWFVTNRHIVYPHPESYDHHGKQLPTQFPYSEIPVDRLKIYLNEENRSMPFSQNKFTTIGKIHANADADVAMISIKDFLCRYPNELEYYNRFFHFDCCNLPEYNHIKPGIGDEVIIIGFPNTKLQIPFSPTMEYASIVTEWGELHNGCPCFKINKELPKGFSGRPVILKNRKMFQNDSFLSGQEIILLGIFSGIDQNCNGMVMYASLINEIIKCREPFFLEKRTRY
jgi:hypothetical protein